MPKPFSPTSMPKFPARAASALPGDAASAPPDDAGMMAMKVASSGRSDGTPEEVEKEEEEKEEEEEKKEEEEEKWEKKKEEVVWTRPVGIKSGASTIITDARTSEAVAQASKQVASEPLRERQDEEARYPGEPEGHPRHLNPLNRARERRRARLEAEPTRPEGQGKESGGGIK